MSKVFLYVAPDTYKYLPWTISFFYLFICVAVQRTLEIKDVVLYAIVLTF